jgi:hypothetical protein
MNAQTLDLNQPSQTMTSMRNMITITRRTTSIMVKGMIWMALETVEEETTAVAEVRIYRHPFFVLKNAHIMLSATDYD